MCERAADGHVYVRPQIGQSLVRDTFDLVAISLRAALVDLCQAFFAGPSFLRIQIMAASSDNGHPTVHCSKLMSERVQPCGLAPPISSGMTILWPSCFKRQLPCASASSKKLGSQT